MSTLPPCPKCNSEYTYEDGTQLVCPECAHEWSATGPADAADDARAQNHLAAVDRAFGDDADVERVAVALLGAFGEVADAAAAQRARDEAVEARRLRTGALRAIDREPMVVGAFLWKWFPGDLLRGDFRLAEPPLRQVIRDGWGPQ